MKLDKLILKYERELRENNKNILNNTKRFIIKTG